MLLIWHNVIRANTEKNIKFLKSVVSLHLSMLVMLIRCQKLDSLLSNTLNLATFLLESDIPAYLIV